MTLKGEREKSKILFDNIFVYEKWFLCSAIEKYWWSSKSHFNKRVMVRAADPEAEDLDADGFKKLVLESVNSIPVDKVLRLCTSNRRYVAQVLKSQVNQAQWPVSTSKSCATSSTQVKEIIITQHYMIVCWYLTGFCVVFDCDHFDTHETYMNESLHR